MTSLKIKLKRKIESSRVRPNKPPEIITFSKGEEVEIMFEGLEKEDVITEIKRLDLSDNFEELNIIEKVNMGDTQGVLDLTKKYKNRDFPRKKNWLYKMENIDLEVGFESIEVWEIRPE